MLLYVFWEYEQDASYEIMVGNTLSGLILYDFELFREMLQSCSSAKFNLRKISGKMKNENR